MAAGREEEEPLGVAEGVSRRSDAAYSCWAEWKLLRRELMSSGLFLERGEQDRRTMDGPSETMFLGRCQLLCGWLKVCD
jgi:hypothetical protein